MGFRFDSIKAWFRTIVADGQVIKRSGNGFVGVDPGELQPAGDFEPVTTDAYDLGETSTPLRWRWANLSRGIAITHGVLTSGVRTAFTLTGAADTGRTASTEQKDVYWNLTRTVTWATGAITAQRFVHITAPTMAFVGASTVDDAATVCIAAAPTAGANATITRNHALWVVAGMSRFDGGVFAPTIGPSHAQQHTVPAVTSDTLALLAAAQTFSGVKTFTASPVIAPTLSASGTPTVPLSVTAAADTAITASTEAPSAYLNLAATRQWATGALTNQRFFRISAPTVAFVGASTLTNAAVLYIEGAAIAGANATITNNYAVWVDAGRVRFDGPVVQNDYPVINNTGTVASPATTINTPRGITVVANGATSVAVTCAACTAETVVHATIMNATTNNVSVRAVIPGSGSFVVHVTGDPGASTAIIGVTIVHPGDGT